MDENSNYVKRNLTHSTINALNLPLEKRIDYIRQGIWVRYPLAEDLLIFLDDLDNQTRRPRMMVRALVRPTGNGKTTIIKKYIKYIKEKRGLPANTYEYVYIITPSEPTI